MPVSTVPPVPRVIASWRREAPAAVVLRLDCGHDRHVHHRPPLASHPWVADDAACVARVGAAIECLRCGQRVMPEVARAYRRTSTFDASTLPVALHSAHSTKAGVWGRVVVEEGQLHVWFDAPLAVAVLGHPEAPIAIPPQLRHEVRLAGPVRFHIEFLRTDEDG